MTSSWCLISHTRGLTISSRMVSYLFSILFFYSCLFVSTSYPCGVCQCFPLKNYSVLDCSNLGLTKINTPRKEHNTVLLNGNALNCMELRRILNYTSPEWIDIRDNPALDCKCLAYIKIKVLSSDCLYPSVSSTSPPTSYLDPTSTASVISSIYSNTSGITPTSSKLLFSVHTLDLNWILASSILVPLTFIIIFILYKMKQLRRRRVPQHFELGSFNINQEVDEDEEEITLFHVSQV